MSGEIHEDKGRLFIRNFQGLLEALGLSSSDIILDFSVAEVLHLGSSDLWRSALLGGLAGLSLVGIGQSLYDSAGVIGPGFEMSDSVPEGLDLRN